MLFKNDNPTVFSLGKVPFGVPCLLLALLVAQPTASRRRFELDNARQSVDAIVDLEFTLTLTASEDGKIVDSIELTEQDVTGVHPPSKFLYSGYESIDFHFKELRGQPTAVLNYYFKVNECTDCKVGKYSTMSRYVYLSPRHFFDHVLSSIGQIKFGLTSRDSLNIGDIKTSYLCEKTERVSFKKIDPKESDGYKYSVKLETRYFHAQPFDIYFSRFSLKDPTLCGDVSNASSSSKKTAIIAGSVVGGVVLLAVIVIAVVLLLRRYRN